MDRSRTLGIESCLSVASIQSQLQTPEPMTDPPSQESVYALEGALPCKGSGSCVSYNFGCFKVSVCTKIYLPREVLGCSNLPLRNVLVTANVSALTGFTTFARFSMSI
jgi:hypothetical protein